MGNNPNLANLEDRIYGDRPEQKDRVVNDHSALAFLEIIGSLVMGLLYSRDNIALSC